MWPNDLTQAALHACPSIRSSLDSLASEPDTLRQINRLVESIGIALDGRVQALWLAVEQAASASLALAHAWTRWMLHGNAETSAALGQALSAWWASPPEFDTLTPAEATFERPFRGKSSTCKSWTSWCCSGN
jgi:hypothetical protein